MDDSSKIEISDEEKLIFKVRRKSSEDRLVIFFLDLIRQGGETLNEVFELYEEKKGNLFNAIQIAYQNMKWEELRLFTNSGTYLRFLEARGHKEQFQTILDLRIEAYKELKDSRSDGMLDEYALGMMADTYSLKGDFHTALELYNEVLEKSQEHKLFFQAVEALANIGVTFVQLNKYEEARKYLEEALIHINGLIEGKGDYASERILQTIGGTKEERMIALRNKILNSLGIVEGAASNFDQSVEYYNRSMAKVDGQSEAANHYNTALTLLTEGKYIEALSNSEISLNMSLEINNKPLLGRIYLQMAEIYIYMNQPENTRSMTEKVFEISDELDDKFLALEALRLLGVLEMSLKNVNQAIAYYEQGIKLRDELNEPSIELFLSTVIMYMAQKNIESARKLLDRAIVLCEEAKNKNKLLESYSFYVILLVQDKKSDEANIFLKKAKDLREATSLQEISNSTLHRLALANVYIGDPKAAIVIYSDSLQKNSGIRNFTEVTALVHQAGISSYEATNVENAREYFYFAYIVRSEIGDNKGANESLYNLGACYVTLGNIAEAESDYDTAVDLFMEGSKIYQNLKVIEEQLKLRVAIERTMNKAALKEIDSVFTLAQKRFQEGDLYEAKSLAEDALVRAKSKRFQNLEKEIESFLSKL